MQLPNTSKISNIQEELKTAFDTGLQHIDSEIESFIKIIKSKVTDLETEISNSVKEVVELNKVYKILKSEIEAFEEQKKDFLQLKESLDKRTTDLNKQEEDLLALHKVLDNKRLVIKAQEEELIEKRRRTDI